MRIFLICFLTINLFSPHLYSEEKGDVVIYPKSTANDRRYDDLIELLKLLLEKTKKDFGPYVLKSSNLVMNEKRMRKQIKANNKGVNIFWNAPTKEAVKDFLPINFPTRKGILGYRVFIINKENILQFKNVEKVEDLKKLILLQGPGWADVEIFKENNFNVIEGGDYEGLFGMMSKQRADYFSRGITEAFEEVESRKKKFKNLFVEESILLYYDWPFFFLVNKNNEKLKKRLETGFNRAIKDGSRDMLFDKYYSEHIKRAKIKSRKIFKIKNSNLWEGIDRNKSNYWLEF